jgi:hypothetical protein
VTAGVTVVVPTLGRPSLTRLLDRLAGAPVDLVVVDDRAVPAGTLPIPPGVDAKVLTGRAAGPAAARNVGWRTARTEWVAFLDDDVVPDADWAAAGRPDRRAGLRRRRAGQPAGPAAGRPAADGLGTGHRRAGRRRVDHRGHGVPA